MRRKNSYSSTALLSLQAELTFGDKLLTAGHEGVPAVEINKGKTEGLLKLGEHKLTVGQAKLKIKYTGIHNDNMIGFYRKFLYRRNLVPVESQSLRRPCLGPGVDAWSALILPNLGRAAEGELVKLLIFRDSAQAADYHYAQFVAGFVNLSVFCCSARQFTEFVFAEQANPFPPVTPIRVWFPEFTCKSTTIILPFLLEPHTPRTVNKQWMENRRLAKPGKFLHLTTSAVTTMHTSPPAGASNAKDGEKASRRSDWK